MPRGSDPQRGSAEHFPGVRCRAWSHKAVVRAISSDRRGLRLAAVIFLAATLLALLATAQAAFWRAHEGEAIPWLGLLKARLADCYIYALFVPAIYQLARRFPLDRENWLRSVPAYLLAGLVCALLKEMLYVMVGNWFRPGIFVLPDILAEDYLSEVVTFWALIGMAHAFILYETAQRIGDAPAAVAPPVGHLIVRDRGAFRRVRVDEVDWIDAQGNYARLNTAGGRYLVRETMTGLERRLGERFVRVHRRAIVNRDRIVRLEPRTHGEYLIVLCCGAAIASGRSYNDRLRRLLG